jgi:L-asparagine oxygenase
MLRVTCRALCRRQKLIRELLDGSGSRLLRHDVVRCQSAYTEFQVVTPELVTDLNENGFVLWRELAPASSTIDVSATLGKLVDIEDLLPGSGIPTVQLLRPRESSNVGQNQYSRNYGLGDFPLHSDLAHWSLPPRYFLLRCIEGTSGVFTRVLPWTAILPSVGLLALERAVFAGRKRRFGCSSLVRAMSRHETGNVFRWDQVFLKPLNTPAQELAMLMRDSKWAESAREIPLCHPGDTVLIDNWRTLHGRSPVPAGSTGRLLERVYLSQLSL